MVNWNDLDFILLNSIHHIRHQIQPTKEGQTFPCKRKFRSKLWRKKIIFLIKNPQIKLKQIQRGKVTHKPQDDVEAVKANIGWPNKFVLVTVSAYLNCCLQFTNKFQYNRLFDTNWLVYVTWVRGSSKGFDMFRNGSRRSMSIWWT